MITKFSLFDDVDIDDEATWKTGDWVYCKDNLNAANFKVGKKYKIEKIRCNRWNNELSYMLKIIVNGTEVEACADRFTKDPRKIVQQRFDL